MSATTERPVVDWYADTKDGEFVLRTADGEVASDPDLLAAVAEEAIVVPHPFGGVYCRARSGPGIKTFQVRGAPVTVWFVH